MYHVHQILVFDMITGSVFSESVVVLSWGGKNSFLKMTIIRFMLSGTGRQLSLKYPQTKLWIREIKTWCTAPYDVHSVPEKFWETSDILFDVEQLNIRHFWSTSDITINQPHKWQCIPANPSTFYGIFPHLNHVFRIPYSSQNVTESQILQNNNRFPPNRCQVSHPGHVVMVERWFVGSHRLYQCQWCLSVTESGTEIEIETGDGQMNRTRETGSLGGYLERISNIPEWHSLPRWDDSGFSQPNVGRYDNVFNQLSFRFYY